MTSAPTSLHCGRSIPSYPMVCADAAPIPALPGKKPICWPRSLGATAAAGSTCPLDSPRAPQDSECKDTDDEHGPRLHDRLPRMRRNRQDSLNEVPREKTVRCARGHRVTLRDEGRGARKTTRALTDLDKGLRRLGGRQGW